MTLRIVRLGSPRLNGEGTRIGAMRHLPRGVKKERYGPDDWLDVWYPELSPSPPLVKRALGAKSEAAQARSLHTSEREFSLTVNAGSRRFADGDVGCVPEQRADCLFSAQEIR